MFKDNKQNLIDTKVHDKYNEHYELVKKNEMKDNKNTIIWGEYDDIDSILHDNSTATLLKPTSRP